MSGRSSALCCHTELVDRSAVVAEPSSDAVLPIRPSGPLTDEDIHGALRADRPKLVAEAFQMAQREIENEEKRRAAQDAKATSLLAAAGVSLTLVATFAVRLVLEPPSFLGGVGWHVAFVVLVGVSLLAALGAAWSALGALRMETIYSLNEHDIVSDPAISHAGKFEDSEVGLASYRIFLYKAIWPTYQRAYDLRQVRAGRLRRGQRSFIAFLASTVIIVVAVAAAGLARSL